MRTIRLWVLSLFLNFMVASGTEEVFRLGRDGWQAAFKAEYAFVFFVWGLLAVRAALWHVRQVVGAQS
jgi:hypothetical protein